MNEPELFGSILGEGVKRTVVGEDGFELPSEVVGLNPACQISSIGGPNGDGSVGVDVWQASLNVSPTQDKILIWSTSPLILNAVSKILSEACRASGLSLVAHHKYKKRMDTLQFPARRKA
jgi:hypothetical protein